jgi:alkylation response protein AidB-like acyl-CoA dehydrogenase
VDLELTHEQQLLAESVQQLLSHNPGPQAWSALVEFGAMDIAAGDDVGAVELALVARELGLRLEATPFIDTCAAAYAARGTALAEALQGTSVALALLEPGGSWSLDAPAATLAGKSVDGRKVALGVDDVDAVVVLAEEAGTRQLALVPNEHSLTSSPVVWIDEYLAPAVVTFEDARANAVHRADGVIPHLMAIGGVLAAAEATGAAAGVLELARRYAGERRQFGRTIGSFQALRHMLADMYVKQDSSWSTVLFAAAALEEGADDALRTAAIAKAFVSRATQEVAQAALQVFGGIAFTAEHPAHRYLRRIIARGQQFGDARHHERLIGRALVDAPDPVGAAR